jgi:AGZA family xanthine/uracil permease-like MFS transporter
MTATQPAHIATMQDVLISHGTNTELNGFLLHGLNILERGYIFTCMIVAAVSAFLIDRRFYAAAGWALAAAVLTVLGLIHAYQLSGNVIDYLPIFTAPVSGAFVYRGYDLAVGYFLMAILFAIMGRLTHKTVIEPPANTLEDARVTDDLATAH